MCTRISLTLDREGLAQAFPEFVPPTEWRPRYNLSPGQPVLAVLNDGAYAMRPVFWGWRKPWAPEKRSLLVNARAETAHQKPTFREAFLRRRCLVLADGFYEWKDTPRGKRPWRFTLKDGRPFALAGLWVEDQPLPDGTTGPACLVLTVDANALVGRIHPRMPLVLPRNMYEVWLAPHEVVPWDLKPLLRPYPDEGMRAHPVDPRCNNPRFDDPICVQPYEEGEAQQPGLFHS